jgi:hypothetical protein
VLPEAPLQQLSAKDVVWLFVRPPSDLDELDKRNFCKKILATGILQDTGAKKMEDTHRPACLYRFHPAAEGKL